MAMVESDDQIRAIDAEVMRLRNWDRGDRDRANIETAKGLIRLGDVAAASKRVTAMLLATEDMVADLGGELRRDVTGLRVFPVPG
jgi:citrate lyase subunit beta/citryl-CoA lyase